MKNSEMIFKKWLNSVIPSILLHKTDQSGFNYEIVSKRTLDIRGPRTVDAAFIGNNKTTHLYMKQMTIIEAGKFIGPLILVLK